MKVEYTNHAEKRIKQRNISKRNIRKSLVNFDDVDSFGEDKFILKKKFGKKNLVVVFMKKRDYYKIITSYYEN